MKKNLDDVMMTKIAGSDLPNSSNVGLSYVYDHDGDCHKREAGGPQSPCADPDVDNCLLDDDDDTHHDCQSSNHDELPNTRPTLNPKDDDNDTTMSTMILANPVTPAHSWPAATETTDDNHDDQSGNHDYMTQSTSTKTLPVTRATSQRGAGDGTRRGLDPMPRTHTWQTRMS